MGRTIPPLPVQARTRSLSPWTFAARQAFLPEIRQGQDLDKDYRELARRLFVAAVEITETAHEAATAGQSGALSAEDYVAAAQRLWGWRGESPPWPRLRR